MRYNFDLATSTLLSLLILSSHIEASPVNSYPLPLQYPPLIQYGQEFNYQLPSNTFTSTDNTDIVYTVDNLPTWLSFDSSSRVFSGTAPQAPSNLSRTEDIWFDLIATDASGELSLNSSFAVSNIDFASVSSLSVLTTALKEAGSVAGPDTLVLKPGNAFSFTIPKSIFVSPLDNPISQFYSLLSSHTPLPSWISFNTDTFTFSGTTPPTTSSIAPSQTYSASLLAIQVPGFSSANLAFNMVVGPHQFSTNILSVNQTLVRGKDFTYKLPLTDILLDGEPVETSDISNVQTNSSWISSNTTFLSGKVPDNFANSTYSLNITNKFADSVEIQLNLFMDESSLNTSSTAGVFTESALPELNVTAGEFFTFTIPTSAINSSSSTHDISLQSSPSASWLEFHSSNMTLNGLVPEDFEKTQITLVNNNNDDDRLVFSLYPTDKLNSASTSSPTPNEPSDPVSKGSSKKTVAIVCGVVIPVAAIIIALLLFFFCFRRRRRNIFSIIRGKGLRGKISRPIITSYSEKAPDFARKTSDFPNTPNSQTNFYTTSTEKLHDPYDSYVADEFDSPGGATKFNMHRLDNPKSAPFVDFQGYPNSLFSGESDDTHIDHDAQIEAMQRNIMQQLEKANSTPALPAPAIINKPVRSHSPNLLSPLRSEFSGTADSDAVIAKPRNSWRRSSQPKQRWHARGQGGSLATIASGEIPSIRMIDHAELPEMADEDGSPVVRPVSDSSDFSDSSHYSEHPSKHTSNSGSIGSYSSSETGSDNREFGPTVPYSNNVTAIVELPEFSFHASGGHTGSSSTAYKRTEETSEADNAFRTASSGDEYMDAESSGDEDDVLKPYVNAQGQWEWGTVSSPGPIVYGQALEDPYQRTSACSDVGTITNANPQGRDEYAMSSTTLRRKESTKLVSFTKERSASVLMTNHTQTSIGSVMQGESAELSYMP